MFSLDQHLYVLWCNEDSLVIEAMKQKLDS